MDPVASIRADDFVIQIRWCVLLIHNHISRITLDVVCATPTVALNDGNIIRLQEEK